MTDGLFMMGWPDLPRPPGASSDIGTFAERPEPERLDPLPTSPHGWEMIDVRGEQLDSRKAVTARIMPTTHDLGVLPAERRKVESSFG